ncbi:MAG: restriction endonuclease subunit S [Gammaproteobacteria bacterium]|nr:restriction endonuclease subunit S [Gammaproteobacteria bacterium]
MKAWESVRLADCCIIKPPKSEARKKLKDTDLVSFVPMNNLGIDTPQLFLGEDKPLSEVSGSYTYFADNDVLLAKITPCFENGKLGIAKGLTNGVGFGSSEYIVFRTSARLLPEFLYYYLARPSFREAGSLVMTGAVGHKRVSKEFIENTEIPLPPVQEQRRIVAILDKAFADIDKARALTEQNVKNARELFESYLYQIYGQPGEGWVEEKMSDVCEGKITDGTHQTPKYFDEGYIFLSSKNVTSGVIDWSDVKYIDESQHAEMQKRLSPKRNDILLAKNGTTGVAAIVDKDEIFDIYVSLALLRPSEKIEPRYLLHFVNSSHAKNQFNKRLKGIGVPNLHLEEIRDVTVPYPTSKLVQKQIVDKIDNLLNYRNSLEDLYRKKLVKIEALRKSILQKAFSGELTKSDYEEAAA